MRLVIVGADIEENLGVGYVAAAALRAGHDVSVVPLRDADDIDAVADRVLALQPTVVGLSIQFQHRIRDHLTLAAALRQAGFAGHITCGGQPPSLAWPDLLARAPAIDSIVLFEGEETIVELLAALTVRRQLTSVVGLALRAADGSALTTGRRPLTFVLDEHPEPLRYRPHTRLFEVPVIPVLWTRGCWGSCNFCSVTTFYREAREHHRGGVYRQRSIEGLADEMARLHHAAGGAIFVFTDDTFLLPRPEDSLARLFALRDALDERGVGRIGLCAKVRPDALTPELALELRRLGVVRLDVGVENASDEGLAHLQHPMSVPRISAALDACRDADIFAEYHLQLFEPGTQLQHVADNLAFVRRHARQPAHLGRAEAFVGTPLHHTLQQTGQLRGDLCVWGYRLQDDRAELLRRIGAAVLRQRDRTPRGLLARCCALGFRAKALKLITTDMATADLDERATELCGRVVTNSVDHLENALAYAAAVDVHDRTSISEFTTALGLRVAVDDAKLDRALAALCQDVDAWTAGRGCGLALDPIDADGVDQARAERARAFVRNYGSAPLLSIDQRGGARGLCSGDGAADDETELALPRDEDGAVCRGGAGVEPRSDDLALAAPPAIGVALAQTNGGLEVRITGAGADDDIRVEVGAGEIVGRGAHLRWHGARCGDQVRVAVRSASGVAIAHRTVRT